MFHRDQKLVLQVLHDILTCSVWIHNVGRPANKNVGIETVNKVIYILYNIIIIQLSHTILS